MAPLVTAISPALLWHFDEAGWNVLGYQYAPGRHADYRPGSPDLNRVVHLMETLSRIEAPADPDPLKRAEDRWKSYVEDPGDELAFAGTALTHTDWAPDNILIAPDRPWLIDWAWPTLGAAWTDPACWLLRLMAAGGHTPAQAEHQAARLTAFAAANPVHIDRLLVVDKVRKAGCGMTDLPRKAAHQERSAQMSSALAWSSWMEVWPAGLSVTCALPEMIHSPAGQPTLPTLTVRPMCCWM